MVLAIPLYALIALAQPIPLDGAQAPQRERVMQSMSLRQIIGSSSLPRPPRLGSLLGRGDDDLATSLIGRSRNPSPVFDSDQITNVVRTYLGSAADQEGVFLEERNEMLLLGGPPEVVERGRAIVRHLASHVARPILVTARLYRAEDRIEPVGVLSAGRLDEYARGMQLLWEASATTRSNRPVALAKERFTRFVRDVDVEVAERADIGDPKVDAMFEGVRVVVEPHALTGSDDLVVFSQLAIGERRGPMQIIATGMLDYPSLDVPVIEANCGSMSCRLANGGTMLFSVLGSQAGGSRMVLAISLRYGRPIEDTAQNIGIYPISGLTSESLSSWVRTNQPTAPGGNDSTLPLTSEHEKSAAVISAHGIGDLMQDVLADRLDQDEASIDVTNAGYLIVFGDSDAQGRVVASLTRIQQEWLRTIQVEATTSMESIGSEPGVFQRGVSSDGAGATLHRVCFPALLGRPHFALRGLESTTIQDLEVEIAQRATASNPVVVNTFSGVFVSIMPYTQLEGIGAHVRIDLSHVAPTLRRPVETKSGGDLYLPQTDRSAFEHDGPVPLERALEMGRGPSLTVQESTWRTSQSLRLRAQ